MAFVLYESFYIFAMYLKIKKCILKVCKEYQAYIKAIVYYVICKLKGMLHKISLCLIVVKAVNNYIASFAEKTILILKLLILDVAFDKYYLSIISNGYL